MKLEKRIATICLLVNNMQSISAPHKIDITEELKNVLNVKSMAPIKRRNLIRIFFTSRAVDTFLRYFLEHHSLRDQYMFSIGKYIKKLSNHSLTTIGKLSNSEREQYLRTIADLRNSYLHKSNSYPTGNNEVNILLNEIHTLAFKVSNL